MRTPAALLALAAGALRRRWVTSPASTKPKFERFAYLIYWLCCGIAAIGVLGSTVNFFFIDVGILELVGLWLGSVGVWLFGSAVFHILMS